MKDKRILCVGLVCVDVVQLCPSFPLEDTDQRCIEQHWQRGGNASNNCTVLSKLDAECEFFGTMSGGIFCGFVTTNFESHNIVFDNCVYHDGRDFPLSIVIINAQNGSRTIIHSNKNLPELSIEEFKQLDLSLYSWIHFEGRNIQQVKLMIEYAEKWRIEHNGQYKISVELEKPHLELQILCSSVDVLFIGKDYAQFRGYKSMKNTIDEIKPFIKPGASLVCAWGSNGASGYSNTEGFFSVPAYIQEKTVDTLGAGDTFCAAVLYGLNKGNTLKDSVTFGCQVAGAKVGISGFSQLKDLCINYVRELALKSRIFKGPV